MEGVWLAISFVCTSLLAATAVPSLPVPLAFFPLMLGGGILVMNRVNVLHGALWLALSGIVLGVIGTAPGRLSAYIVTAAVGLVLADRVFAKRSVYALLGLGVSMGTVFVLWEWLHRLLGRILGNEHAVGMSAGEGWWTLLLLLGGLYAGFVIAVVLRRWVGKRFLVR